MTEFADRFDVGYEEKCHITEMLWGLAGPSGTDDVCQVRSLFPSHPCLPLCWLHLQTSSPLMETHRAPGLRSSKPGRPLPSSLATVPGLIPPGPASGTCPSLNQSRRPRERDSLTVQAGSLFSGISPMAQSEGGSSSKEREWVLAIQNCTRKGLHYLQQ